MKAILLSAGLGTRLRPLTLTVPKCLVEIRGRPLLDYWLDKLSDAGIERILINTHWLPEAVMAHVGSSPYSSLIDLIHEPELLGTGGTVTANASWIGDAAYMLAHADNLTDFDAAAFIDAHRCRPKGCAITMLAFETDMPKTCGILEVDPKHIVRDFHEKVDNPPSNLANAAVYICEPEVTKFISSLEKTVVDFSTEVIPNFLGKIFMHKTEGYHRDIGSTEALKLAEKEFR